LKESRARLQALPQHRLTEYNWYLLGMMERNYQEILDRLGSMPYTYFGETNFYVPRDLALASIYHALNEKESATRYASRARAELEQAIQKSPEDTRFYTALGLAYAYLGNKARAIEEGKKALELNPTAKNAFESPQDIRNMAAIYTLVGEHDEALNQLEFLLSIPCGNYFSVSTLRLDPTWDPLRQNPRFERLLEENSKGTKFQIDPAKLAAARE
jgi:serine/threonine-protein kinase